MASKTGILSVNGTNIIDPKTMEWQIMSLDAEEGTGRDQTGTMHRDMVGTKRKLVCSFPPLTASECSTLLKAVQPKFFTLTYPDALTGGKRTSTFYVGDRKAPVYTLGSGANNTGKWLWVGTAFDFIER